MATVRWVLGSVLVIGLVVAAALATSVAFRAQAAMSSIATLPTVTEVRDGDLTADGTVEGHKTTLVFGIGAADMDAQDAEYIAVPDWQDRRGAERTDVLLLVMVDTDHDIVEIVSLPRDLWVPHRGTKLNAVLPRFGVGALVDDVERLTGAHIDHLARTDFLGFAALTDALGGVEVTFDERVRDRSAHLVPTGPGVVELDGPHALAWVRSRQTERFTADGQWVPAPDLGSDLGRIDNQQRFLLAVWDDLRGPQLLLRADDLLTVVESGYVEVDADLTPPKLFGMARAVSTVGPGQVGRFTWPGIPSRAQGQWVFDRDLDAEDELAGELSGWVSPTDGW